jgi:hypothetical protein
MGEIKSWWLRAAFTRKPAPSDTRPMLARLFTSLRLVVKGSLKKGITYIGVKGGADF